MDLPTGVAFGRGNGNLECLRMDTDLATAEIYLHGAHLTFYQPRDQQPVIWLSRQALFQTGKAIRGGIPICFPWFGPKSDDPKAPAHGTARTSTWEIASAAPANDGAIQIELTLPSEQLQPTYRLTIGRSLHAELSVQNNCSHALRYEAALHTYFVVSDVRQVEVHGLERASYLDRLKPGQRLRQDDRPLTFAIETDRTYMNTDSAISIVDPGLNRRIVNRKRDSRSTVVWNPWIEKARAMSDFGDDEWPGMLCIETANVGENAVTLAPGQSHTMGATIEVA